MSDKPTPSNYLGLAETFFGRPIDYKDIGFVEHINNPLSDIYAFEGMKDKKDKEALL